MAKLTPWQMVVEALKAEGIDRVFGLPGNPLHFVADLNQHSDIKPVLVRHEHSGAALAYATARMTGHPAVCFANPGPGISGEIILLDGICLLFFFISDISSFVP